MGENTQGESFMERNKEVIKRLGKRAREQLLTDIIPFWEERVADWEYGGYFNCFNREGNRYKDCKPGWFVGRNMYMFSALYRLVEPREEWLKIAEWGRKYMNTGFYAGNGRFNMMLGRTGEVVAGTDSIFTDHFAVKGLYSYIAAAGKENEEEEIAFARFLSDRLFENVKKQEILRKEGIREGLQKHAVNFMTLLAGLESRLLFGERYGQITRECVYKSLYQFASDTCKAPLEYIKEDGSLCLTKEGRLIDAGHTMESLWFAMKAGLEYGKPEYISRAETVLDWVITRCYDEEYGGFFQLLDMDAGIPEKPFQATDYNGIRAPWDSKIWWVQAEGMFALLMSALLNENDRHLEYCLRMYDYVENCFRDKCYGEWYSILNRDNSVLYDCKGFELKGPYHIPRCLMQMMQLCEWYLEKGKKGNST